MNKIEKKAHGKVSYRYVVEINDRDMGPLFTSIKKARAAATRILGEEAAAALPVIDETF
jgi:hypothetical protein